MLQLAHITQKEAFAFNREHHRHHKTAPRGARWQHGVLDADGEICGVAIVGRPLARMLDDDWTVEVLRLCTLGHDNACSMLYAESWRVAREMAHRRILTYILDTEDGTSLKAAGWRYLWTTRGGSWDRDDRPRDDPNKQTEPKQAWGCGAWRQLAGPDQEANAKELDRLALVIESAIRTADPKHHNAVLSLIKSNRAAIQTASK